MKDVNMGLILTPSLHLHNFLSVVRPQPATALTDGPLDLETSPQTYKGFRNSPLYSLTAIVLPLNIHQFKYFMGKIMGFVV